MSAFTISELKRPSGHDSVSRASAPRPAPLDPLNVACKRVSDIVERLASSLREGWLAHSCNERVFGELATRVLKEADYLEHLRARDIMRWASTALPLQFDPQGTFGEPPVTLYHGGRFVIDAYTWWSSTPLIHQHAFNGAFYVIEGGSVQVTYDFVEDRHVNELLKLGALELRSVAVLRPGDIQTILPKRDFIHSLYHLDHPSVTLVVRTAQFLDGLPQYMYFPPGIAFETSLWEASKPAARRRAVLASLAKMDPDAFVSAIEGLLPQLDLGELFVTVGDTLGAMAATPQMATLAPMLVNRYGEHVMRLFEAIQYFERIQQIDALRAHVTDADSRLLLGLLKNVPSGDEIRRVFAAELEIADVDERIADLLLAIGRRGKLPFSVDESQEAVLRALVKRRSASGVIEELSLRHDRERVQVQARQVQALCNELVSEPILQNLFA